MRCKRLLGSDPCDAHVQLHFVRTQVCRSMHPAASPAVSSSSSSLGSLINYLGNDEGTGNKKMAVDFKARGNEAFKAANYEEAIKEYTKAISKAIMRYRREAELVLITQ